MEDLREQLVACIENLSGSVQRLQAGLSGGVIDELLDTWSQGNNFGSEEIEEDLYEFFAELRDFLETFSAPEPYQNIHRALSLDTNGFCFDEVGLYTLNYLAAVKSWVSINVTRLEVCAEQRISMEEELLSCALRYYDNTLPGNERHAYGVSLERLPSIDVNEILSKCIQAGAAIIPSLGLLLALFAINDPGSTNAAEDLYVRAIIPCLLVAGLGFLLGRFLCGRIEAAKCRRRAAAKRRNDKRIERWGEQVTQFFTEKKKDLLFFDSKGAPLVAELKRFEGLLTEYIKDRFAFMPEKYLFDPKAAETFWGYLHDRRVDTLKEAINLYVVEQEELAYREKQLEVQQEIAAAEERKAREAERTNDLYQRELQAQMAYKAEMLEKLGRVAREMKESNRIEDERNERISELSSMVDERNEKISALSSKVNDVKNELEKINRS